MSGACNKGLSLIELLIALAIMALVGTIIVPRVWRSDPRQERRDLLAHLNELVGFAQQNAIITGKAHKIEFDFPVIKVFQETDRRASDGTAIFEPLTGVAINPEMTIPKHIEIKQFLIEGIDEMSRFVGSTTRVWFFITAEGIAQPVILNMIDKKDRTKGIKGRSISWVMNPFSSQFKEYNEFQN